VTITHPCHPLCGQRVNVFCVSRNATPQITIQLPDGTHAKIPPEWTDYAAPSVAECDPPADPKHLLDLDGLCQVAQLIDRIRHDSECSVSADGKAVYHEPE
jgi:hypothetical protein